jgi:hypothetical protein
LCNLCDVHTHYITLQVVEDGVFAAAEGAAQAAHLVGDGLGAAEHFVEGGVAAVGEGVVEGVHATFAGVGTAIFAASSMFHSAKKRRSSAGQPEGLVEASNRPRAGCPDAPVWWAMYDTGRPVTKPLPGVGAASSDYTARPVTTPCPTGWRRPVNTESVCARNKDVPRPRRSSLTTVSRAPDSRKLARL